MQGQPAGTEFWYQLHTHAPLDVNPNLGPDSGSVFQESLNMLVKIIGIALFLDGQNHAMVIAESLARVIAAIRITSVRCRSYLLSKTQKLVLIDPAFVALRFKSRDWRAFV